jgi:uncharacterized protein YcbX
MPLVNVWHELLEAITPTNRTADWVAGLLDLNVPTRAHGEELLPSARGQLKPLADT